MLGDFVAADIMTQGLQIVSFHPSLESCTSSRGYYKCEADKDYRNVHSRMDQEGYHQGNPDPSTSLFFENVFRSQKERESETNYRSICPKQNALHSVLQDGDSRLFAKQ